jgi:hypothetical protein
MVTTTVARHFSLGRILIAFALLALTLAAIALPGPAPTASASGCDPEADLSGWLSADGRSGTIKNRSANCSYEVGIASYYVYDDRLETQELYDHEMATIGPNSTITLTVDHPDCRTQVDLFYGPVLYTLDGARYGTRLLDMMITDGPYCINTGRMTGGGSVFTKAGMRVTHGFQIRCDPADTRQNLQINWGNGNKFHLLDMTDARCTDRAGFGPERPHAKIDTYEGWGVGRYNGVDGAWINFTFTDAGEPGTSDTARIWIKDANGKTVLAVEKNTLRHGNHQAHRQ